MKRPNWLRPQIGQGHPGGRDRLRPDREERKESPRPRRLSREDDNRKDRSPGTPAAGRNPQGTRSTFRQEMRAPGCARKNGGRRKKSAGRNGKKSARKPRPTFTAGRKKRNGKPGRPGRRTGNLPGPAGAEGGSPGKEGPAEPVPKTEESSGRDGSREARQKRETPSPAPAELGPGAAAPGSAALLIASYVTLHQPWLAFGRLEVAGNTAVTLDEVKEMGDAAEPLNIFNLNRKKLLDSLRSDYRVEKAELALGWPNILKVVITTGSRLCMWPWKGPSTPNWTPPAHHRPG